MAVAVVGRGFGKADDDEPPVGGLEHLHGHAVEAAEGRCGDHLARGADDGVPGAEVDDPVQVGRAAG